MSVSTFGRVFDVHPASDALTLPELVEALSRFQLKTELARRQRRELERARAAFEAHGRRESLDGPMTKRLERHLGRHRDAPGAVEAAALALADLEKEIRREAKQDLRLWAPTLFAEGARRDDESVVHLSALVLDFDRGPGPEDLKALFVDFFHIAHSTWSHTPEHPTLRLVLPLAAPIAPGDFEALWHFGDARSGHLADPTGRALARAWALPAVPSTDTERVAWAHEGPLLDAVALGLAASASPAPPSRPTFTSYMRRDAAETWLTAGGPSDPAAFDPWDGGAVITPGVPTRDTRRTGTNTSTGTNASTNTVTGTSTSTGTPTPAELAARIDALESRLAALERVLSDYL